MTDPNQPQWQQPNGQPSGQPSGQQDSGVPSVPSAPPVAPQQPTYGAYASPGNQPPVPGGFDAPGAPGSYGSPAGYGAPGAQPAPPSPYGQPNPYAAQAPYGSSEYAPTGQAPTSWRVWTAFPLALIATLFFPPLIGGAAIVLSSLALKRREKLAQVALIVAIACTVLGLVLGAIVNSR